MKLTIIPEGPVAFDGKDYYYTEGEAIYFDNIAKHFDEVEIVTYSYKKGHDYYKSIAQRKFQATNIKVTELPLFFGLVKKKLQIILMIFKLLKLSKNWEFVYIFFPGYPAAFTSMICRFRGIPYSCYLASDWPEESHLLIPWKGFFGKIIHPIYHKLLAYFQDSAVVDGKFTLTAGGLLKSKYDYVKLPVVETIPRLNWPELKLTPRSIEEKEKISLLFVGYLIPRKGCLYLIKAVEYLVKNGKTNYSLTIVGDGEEKPSLEAYVQDHNLQDYIRFTGHLSNDDRLMENYKQADIFIVPSYAGEGFPRVIYEAMTYCLPVIATKVNGIPYKLNHKDTAYLIEPESEIEIADAIEEIGRDNELRNLLSDNSRKFAENLLANSDGGKQVKKFVELSMES
ncbi:glycosyltransferase [Halobacteriovorax sp. GB3]|uniref:glycosyltransferase n=1 Tax=Halobacteriovorax sp. GB3 TaxID=2719615 RepID=UPI00235E3C53|nr:glycosyltransferase [Halobacteriovorax sp. GB3]MDD0852514.1 glycosyltransferase [Halobacteriovorax sp. GB3]